MAEGGGGSDLRYVTGNACLARWLAAMPQNASVQVPADQLGNWTGWQKTYRLGRGGCSSRQGQA